MAWKIKLHYQYVGQYEFIVKLRLQKYDMKSTVTKFLVKLGLWLLSYTLQDTTNIILLTLPEILCPKTY